jgi:hypothetical protein
LDDFADRLEMIHWVRHVTIAQDRSLAGGGECPRARDNDRLPAKIANHGGISEIVDNAAGCLQ